MKPHPSQAPVLALTILALTILALLVPRISAQAQPLSGYYDLADADATFTGNQDRGKLGFSVSGAGDVNGDGLSDFLISAPFTGTPVNQQSQFNFQAGLTYLMYGRVGDEAFSGEIDPSEADVTFVGSTPFDHAGHQVSAAGDVNGDGLDDLLIGTYIGRSNEPSTVHLVYGRSEESELSGNYDLATSDATLFFDQPGNQFRLDGYERSFTVSEAGDVNGDSIDDFLIGVLWADPEGRTDAGETYLFYGKTGEESWSGQFEPADADVTFQGERARDFSGWTFSAASDVNGDGLDDILIGTRRAGPNGLEFSGASYLIYGRSEDESLSGNFNLTNADAIFTGINSGDNSGISLSLSGDLNGDGLFDIVIGALGVDFDGDEGVGEVYVFYGKSGEESLVGAIALLDADVKISGIDPGDNAGRTVSIVGDVDGDGLDDLLIGAPTADGAGANIGEAYLVYGGTLTQVGSGTLNLNEADVTFGIFGAGALTGFSLGAVGDTNGDGLDDLLIGAPLSSTRDKTAIGAAYLIYGRPAIPEPRAIVLLAITVIMISSRLRVCGRT